MSRTRRMAARDAAKGLGRLSRRDPTAGGVLPSAPARRPDGKLFSGGLTQEANDALKVHEARGVTAVAFGKGSGWVAVATDGSVIGRSVGDKLDATLRELLDLGHRVRHVAIAIDDPERWAVITDRTVRLGTPPSELKRAVQMMLEGGQRIDRIAFPPGGGNRWLVLSGGAVMGRGIPGDVLQTIRNLGVRATPTAPGPSRAIDEVAFGPDGGWVVIANDVVAGENVAREAAIAIGQLRDEGRTIDTVSLGKSGQWVVASTRPRIKLPADPVRKFEQSVPTESGNTMTVQQRLGRSKVPGAAVAAVIDNQLAWVTAYGWARAGSDTPVLPETVFQTGSLAKPMTALGILRLVDAGQLGLDEDVRGRLAFALEPHPRVGRGDWSRRKITPRLLMQHRSGVIGRGTTPERRGRGFVKGGGGSHRLLAKRGVRVPSIRDSWSGDGNGHPITITYEPGSKHSYSGAGYLVLQHLVEQVTGSRFDEWMQANVLAPMGMTSSSFALRPKLDATLASGHDSKGRVLEGERELIPWSAAGGLVATAGDMARMVQLLNARGVVEGEQIVSRRLIATALNESLGVFADGGRSDRYSHTGTNGGFRSYLVGWAEKKRGVVILTNGAAGDGEKLRNDIATAVRKAYRW